MSRIAIAAAESLEFEVDLWGTVFKTVPVTRTRAREITRLQRELNALEEDADNADDEAVRLMAELLDHMLAPEPGKRKKPSQLIVEKWNADDLAFKQLVDFYEQIGEAAKRPT